MNRRTVLTLISAFPLQPLLAFAQQDSRVRRIGLLTPVSRETFGGSKGIAEFEQEMRDLGYSVGANLVIEWQFANNHYENLDHLAAELVRKRVEVIVVQNTSAVLAAQRATKEIPIVFIAIGDPVASGIVASLARPGGNTTGTTLGSDLVTKRLDLLMRIVPKMTRVAYLFSSDNPSNAIPTRNLETAAKKVGVEVLVLPLRSSDDIERVFLTMKRERADAAIWGVDGFLSSAQLGQIGALGLKHRVPAIGATEDFARHGGLMSYRVDYEEQWQIGQSYVAKILRGAKPGELPVAQPTRYELVVNVKTARLLGITFPGDILARADKVIE